MVFEVIPWRDGSHIDPRVEQYIHINVTELTGAESLLSILVVSRGAL